MKTNCPLPARLFRFFNRTVAKGIAFLLVLAPLAIAGILFVFLTQTLELNGFFTFILALTIAVLYAAAQAYWYGQVCIWWNEAFPRREHTFRTK